LTLVSVLAISGIIFNKFIGKLFLKNKELWKNKEFWKKLAQIIIMSIIAVTATVICYYIFEDPIICMFIFIFLIFL